MGKLAALLKAISGQTLEERERKLLELEADANITALVPELVYEQIVTGAEEALCMREVLRKATVRMDRPEMSSNSTSRCREAISGTPQDDMEDLIFAKVCGRLSRSFPAYSTNPSTPSTNCV